MAKNYFSKLVLFSSHFFFCVCLMAACFVMFLTTYPIYAANIDGPANVRISPNGTVIFSLNNGVPVKIVSTQGDWSVIQLYAVVDKDPFLNEGKIHKGTIFHDERGLEIGKTLNDYVVEKRFHENNKYIALFEGYTFKTNIIDSANPDTKLKIQAHAILKLTGGLSGEEYLLKGEPCIDCDGPGFSPVGFSAEEVLKKYPRKEPKKKIKVKGDMDISAVIGQDRLVAKTDCIVDNDNNCNKIVVKLNRNDMKIFSILAGDNSPIDPIQALWTYQNHWFLEVARTKNTEVIEGNAHHVYTDVKGEIIQDGESITKRHGYQEVFGSQSLNGKPFYFFMKDGRIGISFDGQETVLDYDDVPHYQCCSYSVFNPKGFKNMVTFYGKKDNTWYYEPISKSFKQDANGG